MKSFMIIPFAVMVFVLPSVAGADIYSWVDADGVRHFSNISPPVDAEDVTVIPSIAGPDTPETQADVDTPRVVFADEQQSDGPEAEDVRAPDPTIPRAVIGPEAEDYTETPETFEGESDIYGAVHRYYDTYPAGLIVYTGGYRSGYSGYRYAHRYPKHHYKKYSHGRYRHKYKYRHGGHRYGHGRYYHKYKHRYDGHRKYYKRHHFYSDDRGRRYKHRSHKYDYYKDRHYKHRYYHGKSFYRDRYYRGGPSYRHGFSGRYGHRGHRGFGARIYIGK